MHNEIDVGEHFSKHSRHYYADALEKISKRYFFESDMLLNLYLVNAVVLDIPMPD